MALQGWGSLLPVGITKIEGQFERGDIVEVVSLSGQQIGVGVVNYAAENVEKIIGKQSAETEKVLGFNFGEAVVHHNNLVLV